MIKEADPDVAEEIKWKKPSNPAGEPVWSHHGILCIGNTLKASVRLTFPKGAQIPDPQRLFNALTDSRTRRAIDVFEGVPVPESGIRSFILEPVRLNGESARSP